MKKLFLLFIAASLFCFAERPTLKEMRDLWAQRTQGTNLALGKKCQLVPDTDYRLTKSDSDPYDLTDGKFASKGEERLWFYKGTVGWYEGLGHSFIKIDLENTEPVEKIVIRLLGGSTGNFKFPKIMTVHVSKDGKAYHEASSMQKLAPCESNQCDWKRYYYLDETELHWGKAWTYPFELAVNAEARYIILEIKAETASIFSDEMAVIKAETKGADFNEAYKAPAQEIPMEGLLIRTRLPELAIMAGLPAPQKLLVRDLRPADVKKTDFGKLVMEFPKGVKIIDDKDFTSEEIENGIKYEYDLKKSKGKTPVFYLAAEENVTGNASIYAVTSEGAQFKHVVPVKVVKPPVVGQFKRLHVSLSWMSESIGRSWPDFWNNWRRLGFNVVSTFPRWWWNAASTKSGQEYVDAAHKEGFKVIMNDSSLHVMTNNKKPGHEIFCTIPGNDTHRWLCPSYKGEFYQKELERVRRCTRDGKPDYVFYDIEIWHQAKNSSSKCTRCQEAIKASGKTQDEFLFERGKEIMADLKEAIRLGAKDAGIPMPVIGSYGRQPASPKYGIEKWEDTYPSSLDMAQPSLYVAGRAQDIHNCILNNHKILGNKKIIPWLTAGTYGEFDSYKIEQMVLEALLNGANGITYFQASDFFDTPMDFYYHAKALAEIQPYEDLVMDGVVTEVKGNNADMTYSMLVKGKEALLLVGNYKAAKPEVTVTLPFKPKKVLDLRNNATKIKAKGNSLSFTVPKDDIRLFYIK